MIDPPSSDSWWLDLQFLLLFPLSELLLSQLLLLQFLLLLPILSPILLLLLSCSCCWSCSCLLLSPLLLLPLLLLLLPQMLLQLPLLLLSPIATPFSLQLAYSCCRNRTAMPTTDKPPPFWCPLWWGTSVSFVPICSISNQWEQLAYKSKGSVCTSAQNQVND